jgi:hypothetical protein
MLGGLVCGVPGNLGWINWAFLNGFASGDRHVGSFFENDRLGCKE